jgi:hypothetical protein
MLVDLFVRRSIYLYTQTQAKILKPCLNRMPLIPGGPTEDPVLKQQRF